MTDFYNTIGTVRVGYEILRYEDLVEKLFKRRGTLQADLDHAIIGCAGEVGELADAIKNYTIYEKELDIENVMEELGDLLFYMQAIMNKLNIQISGVLQHNASKLGKRYEKLTYSNEEAIARADKNEPTQGN